jgi:hypothetical protein
LIVHGSEQSIRICTIYQILDQVYSVGTVTGQFGQVEPGSREQNMKRHLDAIAAVVGLALAVAAMATTGAGEYTRTMAAEARGYHALFHVSQDQRCDLASLSGTANGVDQ